MFKNFYPKKIVESAYDIDYKKLYESGIRGILFDIDNTLVEHGADSDDRSERLFAMLHKMGFKTCIISNNNEERVMRFNKNIGTKYVFKAGKPSKKGYLKGIKMMGIKPEQALFIGDQLFTDIYGANKAGIDNICVKPIAKHEEPQIILKRKLEWFIFRAYRRRYRNA